MTDTPLNTLVFGPDDGYPVVLCHGLFGQGRNFATLARQLGAAGYRTIAVDLPNHGRSPWTDDLGYPSMADATAETLRVLGISSSAGGRAAAVVGHSMGGKVAMCVALRHPALVDRLCVVDISPVGTGNLTQFGRYVRAMRSIDLDTLPDRETADRLLAEEVDSPTVRAFLLQNLRRADGARPGWRWQMNLDLLGRRLDVLGGWPELDVPPFPRPVLWIAGAESDYVRPEHAPAMRRLFPATRLVRIKNAGHWVHADQPEAFATTLRAFLPPG